MLQSPTRIEELVKIFIHATKVRGRFHFVLVLIVIEADLIVDGNRVLGYGSWSSIEIYDKSSLTMKIKPNYIHSAQPYMVNMTKVKNFQPAG